jgi:restriction system protein
MSPPMTTHTPAAAPRRAIIEPSEPVPQVTHGDGFDWLRALDWRAFEDAVAAAYRRQGFTVLPTAYRADGGIDLILTRGSDRIFVQCKQWRVYQVGVRVVRELFGLVAAHGATGGIVITSGRFTAEAVEFARICGVVLVDGPATARLVGADPTVATVPPAGAPAPAPALPSPAPLSAPAPAVAGGVPTTPWCPICSAPMVQRKARRGPSAGSLFWGCSRYPGCKGVREREIGPLVIQPQRGAAAAPPRSRRRRLLTRLAYRLAQVATIVVAVALCVAVLYGVLLAMLHR